MIDTMEAETRLLFAWCAARSNLALMKPPPPMAWNPEDECLFGAVDGCQISFNVEVILGRTRREVGTIKVRFSSGSTAKEQMGIPAEVSAAALALRDAS